MEILEAEEIPNIKIGKDDFEVESGIEIAINDNERFKSQIDIEIEKGLNEVNASLEENNLKLDELDQEIERLTNTADGLDYIVVVSSGILAGLIDSFWVMKKSMRGFKAKNALYQKRTIQRYLNVQFSLLTSIRNSSG